MGDMFHRLAPYIQDYIYAVSYTHLDVYKRQMHDLRHIRDIALLSINPAAGDFTPVEFFEHVVT